MKRFSVLEPTPHSSQRAAFRTGESISFFLYQIHAKNYFYLGSGEKDRQLLCVKLKGVPHGVVVNSDMTEVITVYSMDEVYIMWKGYRDIPGFTEWLKK